MSASIVYPVHKHLSNVTEEVRLAAYNAPSSIRQRPRAAEQRRTVR